MLEDLSEWKREVDGFYSVDAMVHVELQYLMAYLITAAAILRPGGKLIRTLASATTDGGFNRLVGDVERYWRPEVHGTGRLEWVSGCMMDLLLPRLGFQIDHLHEPARGFYVLLVASLTRPEVGDELATRTR
jgi:hypothetical protein